MYSCTLSFSVDFHIRRCDASVESEQTYDLDACYVEYLMKRDFVGTCLEVR